MRAHGVLGDEEPPGDLVRPEVLVEKQQDLELASRDRVRDRVGDAPVRRAFPDLLEQAARNRSRESGLPFGDAAEELHDPLGRLGLQQVARCTAANRGEEVFLGAGSREDDDLAFRRSFAQPGKRVEAVELGHRQIEQHEIGLEPPRGVDRLVAVAGLTDHVEAALTKQGREGLSGQRMIVHDQDSSSHRSVIGGNARRLKALYLSGTEFRADYSSVRRDDSDAYQAWLWGEVLLLSLLGAALALFVTYPSLRDTYELPQLRLVLDTAVTLAAAIVAVLAGIRFTVEGRRLDFLLCGGFFLVACSTMAFAIAPVFGGGTIGKPEAWAGVVGKLLAACLIAAAPFTRGRIVARTGALRWLILALLCLVLAIWLLMRSLSPSIPELYHGTDQPLLLIVALALQALFSLVALVGFGVRYRNYGDDLYRWLGLAATLSLFAELHYVFTPAFSSAFVSQGDFLRLTAYGVLLTGVWRAIRFAEFGRAVAEERARVAREIHDGLAQYLFTISTHASLLEAGKGTEGTVKQIKAAAAMAQQEARFAILALSSASGNAPFDAALRRYVDVLTADGELDVELEVDSGLSLAPDEQIEVFRIVQEGLANVRKHSGAGRAWVSIGQRGTERMVVVLDDGAGFDDVADPAGQGLKNLRERAAAIGGVFALRSTPGHGTALEVTLRA